MTTRTATTSTPETEARRDAESGADADRSGEIPLTFPRNRDGNYDLSRPRWPFVREIPESLRDFLSVAPVFTVVNQHQASPEGDSVELSIRLPEDVHLEETHRQIDASVPGGLNLPDLAALRLTPGYGGEARVRIERHWLHFKWARFVFFLRIHQKGDRQIFRLPFAVNLETQTFRASLIRPSSELEGRPVDLAADPEEGSRKEPGDEVWEEPEPKLDLELDAEGRGRIRYPSLFDYAWLERQPWFGPLRTDPLLWFQKSRQFLNLCFHVRGNGWLESGREAPLNPRAPGYADSLKLRWYGTTTPKTAGLGDRIPSVEFQASGRDRSGRLGTVRWNTFAGFNLPMASTFYLTWKFRPGESGEDTLVDPTIICDPPEEPLEP